MAKTYEQIAQQIKALQQQADALKRKEVDGVVGRIKAAIGFYGLTAADLGLGDTKAAAPKSAAPVVKQPKAASKKSGKRPSVVRYRDDNGNSWTGMGPKPRWITAGIAGGKSLTDFAVTPDA